jgi:hypothetical protein
LNCIDAVIKEYKKRSYQNNLAEYAFNDTSWRVLKLIMGNAGLSNMWHGIVNK